MTGLRVKNLESATEDFYVSIERAKRGLMHTNNKSVTIKLSQSEQDDSIF